MEINPCQILFVRLGTNQLSCLIKSFSPEQGTSRIILMDGLQVHDFLQCEQPRDFVATCSILLV